MCSILSYIFIHGKYYELTIPLHIGERCLIFTRKSDVRAWMSKFFSGVSILLKHASRRAQILPKAVEVGNVQVRHLLVI